MGLRRPPSGFSIQNVLRGRTLRHIADSGTTIAVNCDACSQRRVWSPRQAKARFAPMLDDDVMRFAEKLSCGRCGSRSFFLTIVPRTN